MLNDFTGGGQIFIHKLRMFFQVLHRSFWTAFLVSLVILIIVSYSQALKLDLRAAATYQKALLADSFDEAIGGLKASISPKSKHSFTAIDAYDEQGLYARDIDPRKIIQSTYFHEAYNELIQLLKFFLLIGLGIMSGVFLLIYMLWARFGKEVKSEKKKAGSSRILTAKEVSRILKSCNKASNFYIGKMPLVKDSETKHFLVTGSTGSGKTNLIHNLLPQVEQHRQPAIVIDQTGEMIAKYYNAARGDIIFNPFDARSHSWDFWSDCSTGEELERFARILFSFSRKKAGHSADPFWEQAAETVFIACVNYQRSTGNFSIEQLCKLLRSSTLRSLQAKLRNSGASRYLDGDSKTTAGSILSVLANSTKPLSYMRDTKTGNNFALKKYFKDITQGATGWLFLATKPSARDLTLALVSCLMELALSQLLDIGIKADRRIWFIIDELSALGKLPALSTLMAEGRKYGACVVSGLQSLNQLYANYGAYEASTIFGQFGTNFFFRNNEPTIAKMVSSMCGQETITRQQKNTSFGAHEFRDGVSYSEQQQQKDLVEYSDLSNMAAGECFVLLPEPQVRIVKLQTPEVKLPNKNAGFIQSDIGANILHPKADAREGTDIEDNTTNGQQDSIQIISPIQVTEVKKELQDDLDAEFK